MKIPQIVKDITFYEWILMGICAPVWVPVMLFLGLSSLIIIGIMAPFVYVIELLTGEDW